jgi:hypothetical protein
LSDKGRLFDFTTGINHDFRLHVEQSVRDGADAEEKSLPLLEQTRRMGHRRCGAQAKYVMQ